MTLTRLHDQNEACLKSKWSQVGERMQKEKDVIVQSTKMNDHWKTFSSSEQQVFQIHWIAAAAATSAAAGTAAAATSAAATTAAASDDPEQITFKRNCAKLCKILCVEKKIRSCHLISAFN